MKSLRAAMEEESRQILTPMKVQASPIHSSDRIYYVPGTMLGSWKTTVTKTQSLPSRSSPSSPVQIFLCYLSLSLSFTHTQTHTHTCSPRPIPLTWEAISM